MGGFSRFESVLLVVLSYVAFVSSIVGILVSILYDVPVTLFLFVLILVSISMVKHIYAVRLCKQCDIVSCPFNPKRRRPINEVKNA